MLGAPAWAAVAETLNYLSNPETNASGVPAASPDQTGTTLAGATPHPKAMVCADFRSELDTATELNQVWQQMETVAPDMRFNFVWWEQPQLRCTGWTGGTTNPQHRLQVRDAPPILMINARDDVATPYEFAAAWLTRSKTRCWSATTARGTSSTTAAVSASGIPSTNTSLTGSHRHRARSARRCHQGERGSPGPSPLGGILVPPVC